MSSKVARRYAKALFELAVESGSESFLSSYEELGKELTLASKVMQAVPQLMEWLHNPTVARREKVKFAQVFSQAMHANRLVANALSLMAEKGRLAYLPQVERFYAQLADRRAGRLRATVISAVPLENQAVQRMGEIFSRATRQNVTIERQVDPSIIGGIVAQVGSRLFDGSTRNQLSQLKKQLQAPSSPLQS